jgi:hypothetical protein
MVVVMSKGGASNDSNSKLLLPCLLRPRGSKNFSRTKNFVENLYFRPRRKKQKFGLALPARIGN